MTGSGESHPSRLSLRAFLVCTATAVLLLWAEGGTLMDIGKLLSGILPVGTQQNGWVHVLLGRAGITTMVIFLALLTGCSLGLLIGVLCSQGGKRLRGVLGWLGRFLADIPLMSLALGTVFLLIQVCKLPVESLFPSRVSAELDTWDLFIARWTWYLMVPASVLAVPVFGMSLAYVLQALEELRGLPLTVKLKARGLWAGTILHSHLLPLFRGGLSGRIRPFLGIALAWSIPVEEILQVDGWGAFMAAGLRSGDSASLASGLYLAGIIMALWYLLPAWLENQRGQPARLSTEGKRSWIAAGAGTVLATALLFTGWQSSSAMWRKAMNLAVPEIMLAAFLALGVVLLVVAVGFLACTLHPLMKVKNGGLAASLCAAPIWVCLLSADALNGQRWITLALITAGVALPEIARHREILRRLYTTDYAKASISLGSSSMAFWYRHGLSVRWSSFGRLFFQSMAQIILWRTLLDFYAGAVAGPTSWGQLIHLGADQVLDDPLPYLVPGICVALWCLSFQLLARGFRVSAPSHLEPAKSRS